MQIVDAQIHLWGTGLPSNPSHWQVTSFTPAQAVKLMDEGGVHAAVIHPPSWDPESIEMAMAAVQDYPGRFAIMGSIDFDDPEAKHKIADWRNQPGMLGLRYTFLHGTGPTEVGEWQLGLAVGGGGRGWCANLGTGN